MKRIHSGILILAISMIMLCVANQLHAQSPPPPPDESGKGTNQNQSPLNAPIDGGLSVIMLFAAGFSGREWVKSRKKIQ